MTDEPATHENEEEELLLTEEAEQEEPAAEPEDGAEPPAVEGDEEEEVFAFGDEPAEPAESETPTIKHMRSELSKAHRELAELRRQAAPEPVIEVGEKPTLLDCDYDEDAFVAQRDAWKERKATAERIATERAESAANQAKMWETELQSVAEEKAALAKPDADEAFDTVRAALSDHQNVALLHTVDKGNRAKLIYALAKSPAKLEQLSQLSGEANLIRFIKEVTKLEGQLKMVTRRKAPEPDVPERPSAGASVKVGGAEKQLAKMEAEWAKKGGDRRHIQKFKRENNLI